MFASNSDNIPAGKRGKKMGKMVGKMMAAKKTVVLGCLVVGMLLMSAVPYAVVPNFLTIKGGR